MKHKVTEIKLSNGAKGLIINVPGASVMSYDFNFRAGDFLCPEDKWETAHIMEHLALGANQEYRSSRKFSSVLGQNGAYFNASTNSHDINYESECADLEWDRVLDLLLLAISKPIFLEKEFKAEMGNVQEELAYRSNNHSGHLSLKMRQQFGFVARTLQDRLKLLDNVTIEDVKGHYKKTHYTQNLRFVIAGDLKPDRVSFITKRLEKLDMPEGEVRIDMPDEIPRSIPKPLYIKEKTVSNIHFYFDTYKLGGRLADPELDSLTLVNNLLTGTLHSRIYGNAREKGLVYGVSSNWNWSKNYTGWWLGAQVSSENIDALIELSVREIRKVLNGNLNLADLQAAKDFALGQYQRGAQTVSSVAGKYSGFYFSTGLIDDYKGYPDSIKSVTRPRAIASYQKMFEDNIWGVGFLGDLDKERREAIHSKLANIWQQL